MKKFTLITAAFILSLQAIKAQQWDGLTYYSVLNSTTGFLIDTNSTVVKTFAFTGGTGYSTHLMPGGFLWRSVQNPGNVLTGGGMTGRIQKVDYSGTVLWDYVYSSSTYCMHHDHCPLPNGNVLIISYDVKTPTDVTNAGANSGITVWSEKVMELKPVGTNSAVVVWEWKLWDHLVQNINSSAANYQTSIVNNPQLMNINYGLQKDWFHMNGIDYNPVLDQIVLSSHNMNEWYILDHSTTTAEAASHSGGIAGMGGDFLYRWGNPAAYTATGTKILNVTHDAHWIPENCANGGNLCGINNKGVVTPSSKTTVDQAIIPRNAFNYTISSGSAFTPATFSTRKITTGYTTNMGSAQEFPNGNQLICLATLGTIYEINSAGTTLWSKSASGGVAQSHRYSLCFLNNPAPAQTTITASGNLLSSSPAASYQWYYNGTAIPSATAATCPATQAGIYLVKTTDGTSCVEAYSSAYSYTTSSGNPVSVRELNLDLKAEVYPNPTTGEITIAVSADNYSLRIFDHTGKKLIESPTASILDLSLLPNGLYILNITTTDGRSINKRISLNK